MGFNGAIEQKFVSNVWSLLEMSAMSNEFGITGLTVAAASNERLFTASFSMIILTLSMPRE